MRLNLSDYWNDFVDLLFPRCCEACKKALVGSEKMICTDCRITLPRMQSDSALKAMLPLKFASHEEVKGVWAYLVFTKKGKVQNLLHELKYNGQQEIGIVLGKMMARDLLSAKSFPVADLILSVPLHKNRLRERGYNQSDAFARGLSEETGIGWSGDSLVRTRYTKSQTGKTKSERRSNVHRIFEATRTNDIRGKKIILVDDVLTTGATLEACVEALGLSGCNTIYIMTIAAAQN